MSQVQVFSGVERRRRWSEEQKRAIVAEVLRRDPHAGDIFVFRGRCGNLIKIIWHDGLGMSLYAKRLEKGRFIWPSPADGVVAISPSWATRWR